MKALIKFIMAVLAVAGTCYWLMGKMTGTAKKIAEQVLEAAEEHRSGEKEEK